MKKQRKFPRIKPRYIEDVSGKVIQVYLDMKSYDSMIARMKKFDKLKHSKTAN